MGSEFLSRSARRGNEAVLSCKSIVTKPLDEDASSLAENQYNWGSEGSDVLRDTGFPPEVACRSSPGQNQRISSGTDFS